MSLFQYTLILCCTAFISTVLCSQVQKGKYDVTWTTPSTDAYGSMPIGNGDIGANVWALSNGTVSILLSKTDAWSETGTLFKLNLLNVVFEPNPFTSAFRQHLNLTAGTISITDDGFEAKVWMDATSPRFVLETTSTRDLDVTAKLAPWRLSKESAQGDFCGKLYMYPDVQVSNLPSKWDPNSLVWYHRNDPANSHWAPSMKYQGLESLIPFLDDPLSNRTFGGAVLGQGFKRLDAQTIQLKSSKSSVITSYALTEQTDDADTWMNKLLTIVEDGLKNEVSKAYSKHLSTWGDFWERGYVDVSTSNSSSDFELVSLKFTLQRYIDRCMGLGNSPIKFNGQIFNADFPNPDVRKWGRCLWFQNTRLPYWNLMGTGDFDEMFPWYEMYLNIIPMAERRSKVYFGHSGSFFPETMTFYGLYSNAGFGYGCGHKEAFNIADNTYIRYYWQGGIELTMIMLDHFDMTNDMDMLKKYLVPIASSVTTFYKEHWPEKDKNGKQIMFPSQSLETWQCPDNSSCVTNPTPDIAGLRKILPRLLALPSSATTPSLIDLWKTMLQQVPEIPVVGGIIQPWEKFTGPRTRNSENTELYTLFPYRNYLPLSPNITVAMDSYKKRRFPCNKGWCQDIVDAAFLGDSEETFKQILGRAESGSSPYRFTGFAGNYQDYAPSEDHYSNLKTAIQYALLQPTDDNEGSILLFPAWPADVNVSFKLYGAKSTMIEATCTEGKLVSLKVEPESRRSAIKFGNVCKPSFD